VISLSGDQQANRDPIVPEMGNGLEDEVHPFVSLQPTKVEDGGLGTPLTVGAGGQPIKLYAVRYHRDVVRGHPPVPEVCGRTLGHSHRWEIPENPWDGTLEEPGGSCHREGGFVEGRGSEKVMDKEDYRRPGPKGHENWDLVQVLNHYLEVFRVQRPLQVEGKPETEGHPSSDPVDLDTVEGFQRKTPTESRGNQGDVVAPSGQPAEHLVEVRLGSPGLGVQPIQPVDNENFQARSPSVCHPRSSELL